MTALYILLLLFPANEPLFFESERVFQFLLTSSKHVQITAPVKTGGMVISVLGDTHMEKLLQSRLKMASHADLNLQFRTFDWSRTEDITLIYCGTITQYDISRLDSLSKIQPILVISKTSLPESIPAIILLSEQGKLRVILHSNALRKAGIIPGDAIIRLAVAGNP